MMKMEEVAPYLPEMDDGQLPEREFFFKVKILDINHVCRLSAHSSLNG